MSFFNLNNHPYSFYAVISFHALFMLFLLFSPKHLFLQKTHRPLIIHTLPLPAQNTITSNTTTPSSQNNRSHASSKSAPMSAPTTPVKKKPTAIDQQSLTATPPLRSQKTASPRSEALDALRKELEESIAKIETNSDKKVALRPGSLSKHKAPAPLHLQIDSSDSQGATEYAELIVSLLHDRLQLPEYGEVTMQLTIGQNGTVIKAIVLKAQSSKNKQYLEGRLPHIRFPAFAGALSQEKEKTITLTFCNE